MQQRLLTMGELINIKEFFESWFQGAEFSTIKQGNVEEFIAYGFFCEHFVNLADQVGHGKQSCIANHDKLNADLWLLVKHM